MTALDRQNAEKYQANKRKRKKAHIIAAISACGLLVMILVAFCLIRVDQFTITTSDDKDLSLSVDETCEVLATELHAPPLLEAMDTQYSAIPENIDNGLGSKNTDYYFAYSFYLLGKASTESINYSMTMELKDASLQLENAIRVMIIKDGIKTVYAKANADGSKRSIYSGIDHNEKPEKIGECERFKENKHIILEPYMMHTGDKCKYTVVMWIDGWESTDSMKDGVVEMSMKFSVISKNNVEN